MSTPASSTRAADSTIAFPSRDSTLPPLRDSTPIAKLTAPSQISAGSTAFLRTTGSQGKHYIWKLSPKEESYKLSPVTLSDESREPAAVLESGPLPCSIVVVLVVVNESGDVAVDVATIQVGDKQPLPPKPPTPDNPQPGPLNPYNPPNPNLQSQLQALKTLVKGANAPTDTEILSKLYAQLAVVTEDATGNVCRSTGDVRTCILGFASAIDKAGIKGRYPGLGKQLDQIFTNSLGSENVYFDDTSRKKAVELLRGVAWGLWEAGHQ